MPLRLPDKLPAIEFLKHENIFVLGDERASSQDIRPLRIVILNLMPLKITTETDLIRLLSNSPLQLDVHFMKVKAHTSKNTPVEHMRAFYRDFEKMADEKFDGMIITGAPVEHLDYEHLLGGDKRHLPLGTHPCHQHTLYLLGCPGGTLLSLWGTQIPIAGEDVRYLPAASSHALVAHLPWIR